MNIQPIKMDKYNARAAQREYAKSVRRHRAERLAQADTDLARARLKKSAIELEDEALQRAYGALGRGKQVINLAAVMRAAGLDDTTKLPRLAIARADVQRVGLRVSSTVAAFRSHGVALEDKNAVVQAAVFGAELTNEAWRTAQNLPAVWRIVAMCPQIPPRYRPEPDKAKEFYLLWEPKWELRPPDPDPFLIKPLGGGFFVIVAHWDMTPLEQSILEGRVGG